ncbi:MAG: hypothetical protein QGH15_20130 [Kiritimatiellia bacterium]|jgi:hypothetical protein|nr:hypothetical protein [Kiritimatiellia bacterium]
MPKKQDHLRTVLPDWNDWRNDVVEKGEFGKLRIATMSTDEHLAIIGFMNALLYDIAEKKGMADKTRQLGLHLPPGFTG